MTGSLSIVSLNLGGSRYRWFQRREHVVSQLLDISPDVIALQAVAVPIRQSQWICSQLNERLALDAQREPYRHFLRRRGHIVFGFLEGVAILTRVRVGACDSIVLGDFGHVALRINCELGTGENVDVVSVQLGDDERAFEAREDQVMQLLGWLHDESSVRHRIIAGTFADTPGAPSVRRLTQLYDYRSAMKVARGSEIPATYPTVLVTGQNPSAGRCIDYVFVSPHFADLMTAYPVCNKHAPGDDGLYPSTHIGLFAELNTVTA